MFISHRLRSFAYLNYCRCVLWKYVEKGMYLDRDNPEKGEKGPSPANETHMVINMI